MEGKREGWLIDVLEAAFRASALPAEELERRLGWEEGFLDQLLLGEAECEPQHVVAVLGELHRRGDRSARRSWEAWQADEEETDGSAEGAEGVEGDAIVEELLQKFRRLGYGPIEELLPRGEPDSAELERRVEAVLRGAFGDRPVGAGRG